jgi:uncharacterized protein YigE (DUF2233 family)
MPVLSRSARLASLVLALTLLACNLLGPTPTPTPTPSSTPTHTLVPTPTPELEDSGWEVLEAGVELRQVPVHTGDVTERLLLVRLDPARFRFRVLYTPGEARRVSEWAAVAGWLPLLVVNGGYFTAEHQATGLLVSDGQVYGSPYSGFAGMFSVLPGGRVEVRWLAERPYDPSEMLLEAVQSFPMLVKPGGVMGFPTDDGQPARRTVVAQDRQGRILFVVAPRGYLTLHEMARRLTGSDLDLDVALNLDGGQSTGLYLMAGETQTEVDSLVPVPSVIAVERRE